MKPQRRYAVGDLVHITFRNPRPVWVITALDPGDGAVTIATVRQIQAHWRGEILRKGPTNRYSTSWLRPSKGTP